MCVSVAQNGNLYMTDIARLKGGQPGCGRRGSTLDRHLGRAARETARRDQLAGGGRPLVRCARRDLHPVKLEASTRSAVRRTRPPECGGSAGRRRPARHRPESRRRQQPEVQRRPGHVRRSAARCLRTPPSPRAGLPGTDRTRRAGCGACRSTRARCRDRRAGSSRTQPPGTRARSHGRSATWTESVAP